MAKGKRGHGEGTIFQRWTARVKVDGKQVTLCGKSLEEVQQKLSALGIDSSKAYISMTWVAQATTGRDYETGKPKRVTYYGKTRKEVSEKLSAALHDVQTGTFVEPTKITFADWLDTWLKEYAKPQVRPTTYDSYEYLIRIHIKPGLGGTYLKDLQPAQIQRFYNQKLQEPKMDRRKEENRKKNPDREIQFLSPRTVRYMHIVIHESLEQALKEGKITRNPAKATRPPKVEKKEASYMNMDDIARFLRDIAGDRWYPAFITVLGSGLRLGEVTALKWSKIDLQKGSIYVNEAVSRIKNDAVETGPKTKLIFQNTKTQKGMRTIPLPADVVNELKRLKTRQAEEKMKLGKAYLGDGPEHNLKQDQWFVFTWPDGQMVEPGYLSKHFLKLIRKSGIPNIHFHSLRHTYASMMLQADVHPKVVQEIIGHSTIGMTLDTYSHVMPGLKEAAAEKLNGFTQIKKPSSAEEG